MRTVLYLTIFLLLPVHVTFAQQNVQWYLEGITIFFNDTIIPLLFSIAILFFFVNVTRYFIIDAADAYKREEARTYALYAVIALVFLTSLWGVVSLVTGAFNIGGDPPICPDYIQGGGGSCASPNSGAKYYTDNPLAF